VGSLRRSITSSHSAHASIVALDRDGPTATEPSSLVGVTAVAAVASVVPLTVCRSPSVDPNAARPYVHTLSQTRRWRSNGHCAHETQRNQCFRDEHGLSPFPVLCLQVTQQGLRLFRWNITPESRFSAAFCHAFFMRCGSSLEAADRAVADLKAMWTSFARKSFNTCSHSASGFRSAALWRVFCPLVHAEPISTLNREV
jgi:hypothetical protein